MESGYPQVQVEASRSMPQHHKICQGTVLTCAYHEVVCNLLPCRARLEGCTEQARKQQQTLQDAKRLVAEMDDMGEDTKAQLRKQREGLEKNIDDVRDTSEEVSKAQSMLSKLTKRFGLW
uniref:t-SNARE coiled-coil homology domain-containing protein n=1 Tax=Eutreptiella gymnastica TaxID=73025 RepID=A0A7S4LEE0_9EUGL